MKHIQLLFYIILTFIFMEEILLAQDNDWANLNRYKEENLKIGLPADNENRVVFIGNSITQGWIEVNLISL